MFVRVRFLLPLIALSTFAQRSLAQPPDAPSTIKTPASNPVPAFAPPPDPPKITSAELQTLTGAPTLVTFSGRDVPVEEVTKALFAAAQISESTLRFPGEQQRISVDWNNVPFWNAAADVERLSGKRWDSRFSNALSLTPYSVGTNSGLEGTIAAQAPFVVLLAQSISHTATRNASLGKKATAPVINSNAQITLSAYFDPKLRVQSSILRSLKFQKQGETALIEGPDNRFTFGPQGRSGPMSQLSLPLPKQATPGTIYTRVTGVLHNVIVSASQSLSVTDLAATPTAKITLGANEYALQNATVDGDRLTVRLSAAPVRAEGQNPGFYFINTFANVRVRDAQGRVLSPSTSSISNGTKATSDLQFQLRNGQNNEVLPGPYSLDWSIPTETRSLDVPFELRDIVVP